MTELLERIAIYLIEKGGWREDIGDWLERFRYNKLHLLNREEVAWEAHEDWLAKEFDLNETSVNFGWVVDEVTGEIASKVYGEDGGVVTTNMHTLETEFERWDER